MVDDTKKGKRELERGESRIRLVMLEMLAK
jgi:hypothetical protein